PTGALDSASGKQIMELFRQLNQEGVTVLMITHDAHIAEQAERMVFIRDGRLSEAGTEALGKEEEHDGEK
ncbi:MAG TPA: macrolide ABC transporter ATP-binding protein, partial [Lachnospiraceae bacterium]|nr:macrolide ABC transporter ATP-binding protein [Lachnospiraceae bacterium]